MRELLAAAAPHRSVDLVALQAGVDEALASVPRIRADDSRPRSYAIRRCTLINTVQRRSRYYGLADEVLAFCLAAGCETLGGLDLAELEALSRWLDNLIAQQLDACDSPLAPPAR